MAGKKSRLRAALKVAIVIVAACIIAFAVRIYLQDRPIPGGIVAYRSHNLKGMRHTHCGCGHKGYYILTDRLVLWYVTDHDSLQPQGEIIRSEGNLLTVNPIQESIGEEETSDAFTIEKHVSKLHIVEPASEFIALEDYTLKLTYLGADIRERVENFDYEEWKESRRAPR